MTANMSPKKIPMPSQAPEIRAHNFDEVALGYGEGAAIEEAMRCLHCKNMPCVTGCPVNVQIPEFIGKIKDTVFPSFCHTITARLQTHSYQRKMPPTKTVKST